MDKEHKSQSDKNSIFGWTLIVPSGWGSAFWHSLAFADTRIGGLRERAQQYFEAGCPSFPEDYACTHAFKIEIDKKAKDLSARWHRTPIAKRVNYERLSTDSPWRPAFAEVLSSGIKFLKQVVENRATDTEEALKAQQVLGTRTERTPYLINGPLLAKILPEAVSALRDIGSYSTMMQNVQNAYEKHVNLYRTKRQLTPNRPLMVDAFVKVRLDPLSRGSPKYNAIIYMLTEFQVYIIRDQLKQGRTKYDIISILEQEEEMEAAKKASRQPKVQIPESNMDGEEDEVEHEYEYTGPPRFETKVCMTPRVPRLTAILMTIAQAGTACLSRSFV